MDTTICELNNAPQIDTRKPWDCLQSGDVCNIKFVIEPFMSMTYYKLKDERELVGYRAYFNNLGVLEFYDNRPSTLASRPDSQK